MAKFYKFPNRTDIEDEACEWLAKLDGDDPLAPDEVEALREWIARSEVHRQEFVRLAKLWDRLNVLTELAVPLDLVEPGRQRVGQRLLHALSRMRWSMAAVASCAIVGLIFTVWVLVETESAPQNMYVTDVGEIKRVQLNDGTRIQLNTDSRFDVEYSTALRWIRLLRGEAYFEVEPDPDRPFVVYAANGMVEAVGTAFSVYVRDEDVRVTVTQGQVDLAVVDGTPRQLESPRIIPSTGDSVDDRSSRAPQKRARLGAGQSTAFNRNIKSLETIESQELTRQLAWREGLLMFNGEPLEEVVNEVSRYTDLSFRINDPAVRNLRVGGQFEVGETEAMFEVLESSFGIQVTWLDEKTVRLSTR